MLRVGIVGLGFMGSTHLQCYNALNELCEVTAVADIRKEILDKAQGRNKLNRYMTVDEMLKNEKLDLIDICLPTYLHKEYVLKAVKYVPALLCEKPIALTVPDAEEMIKACKGKKFMVAQCIRFWPEYQYLKEVVSNGRFGKLHSLTFRRLSRKRKIDTSFENWILKAEKSGSAGLDLHIHDVDFLNFVLGTPKSFTSSGFLDGTACDHIVTTYRYPDGVFAFAEGGWDKPASFPFEMSYVATFDKGVIEYNSRNKPTLALYEGEKLTNPEVKAVARTSDGKEFDSNVSSLSGYMNEIRYFLECIISGKEPVLGSPVQSRDSLALCLSELKNV